MRRLAGALALVLLMVGWQSAAAASSCIPSSLVQSARIARIETSGTLSLAGGRAARLEGILLPAGARDHAPQSLAADAIARLAALAGGHVATLASAPPAFDRYGRVRAQIILPGPKGEIWLQRAILESGMARVMIASDRRECAQELYAAENHARTEKRGIWRSPAYRVRPDAPLATDTGTFQIIEGRIAAVTKSGARIFLDFAPQADFAVVISAADMKNFHRIGVDPFAYEGTRLRVRGWVERIRGRNEIDVATPDAIEVIEQPARK